MNQKSLQVLLVCCAYSLLSFFLQVMGVVSLGLGGTGEAYSTGFNVIFSALEIISVGVPILFVLAYKPGRMLLGSGIYKKIDARIFLVIPLAVFLYLGIIGLMSLWGMALSSVGAVHDLPGIEAPTAQKEFAWGVLVIAIVPALMEELMFRGLMQSAFSAKRHLLVCAVVGGLFAFMHGDIFALPAHLVLGFVICYVVYVTGSIWPGVLMHFLHNTLSIGVPYYIQGAGPKIQEFFGESGPELPQIGAGDALWALAMVALFGALSFSILFLLRRMKAKREAVKTAPQIGEAVSPVSYLPLIPGLLMQILQYGITFLYMVFGPSLGLGG